MIKYKLLWDRLGITLSVVCLVHCLVLHFAIVALPLVAVQWLDTSRLETSTVHAAMALLLLPVALLAAVPGLRMHGRISVAAAMAAGLSLLSTGAFAGEDLLSHEWQIGFTVTGGAILVAAHAVNLALCRACSACAHENDAGHA